MQLTPAPWPTRSTLLLPVLAVAAGILGARAISMGLHPAASGLFSAGLGLAVVLALATRAGRGWPVLLLGLLLLGFAGLGALRYQQANAPARHALAELRGARLHYRLALLKPLSKQGNAYATWARVDSAWRGNWGARLDGKILLRLPAAPGDSCPAPGTVLQAELALRPIEMPPRYEGYERYLALHGLRYQGRAYRYETAGRLEGWQGHQLRWQYQLAQRLGQLLPDSSTRGVAQAILLGVRAQLDSRRRDAYAASGLAHVLALSGLHTGILLLLINLLMQGLGQLGLGLRWRILLPCLMLAGFALLTGLSTSVSRAALMGVLLLLPPLLRRSYNSANALAFAALLLLLVRPNALFLAGFQFSFLAVAGILLLFPALRTLWRTRYWADGFLRDALFVSLAAQVFLLPPLLYHFGTFPVYFLAANLAIALPALATVAVGIVLLPLVGVPYVNTGLAWLLHQGIRGMNAIASCFAGLPHAQLQVEQPSLLTTFLAQGLILLIALHIRRLARPEASTNPLL
jgi:competence protein ComEC